MPGMLEEAREQVELLARQLDLVADDGDDARVAAQHDVARGQHLVLVAVLDAAEDRLDARGELARRERLRDVVVGAELEAGDAVGLLVARGEHHDRHLRVRAHLPAHLEAVDPGKPDVEHDEPHRMASQLGDRLLAGADPDDRPAVLLLEVGLHETADRLVVFDEEKDAPGRRACHVLSYLAANAFYLHKRGRLVRLAVEDNPEPAPQMGDARERAQALEPGHSGRSGATRRSRPSPGG